LRNRLLAILLLVPTSAAAADYSTCFHVVPPDTVATIQADLDCSAEEGVVSFVLEDGARLELNGHSLLGNASSGAVVCRGQCEITGPGDVSNYGRAIYGESGAVEVSDLVLSENRESIDVVGRLTATRVDATSSQYGVRASRTLKLDHVSVTNTGGDGILGRKILGTDVTVTGSYEAVGSTGTVRLTRLIATDNIGGVSARKAFLTDSVLSSASTDVLTLAPPVLDNTSCDDSARLLRGPGGFVIGPTWGVCAND